MYISVIHHVFMIFLSKINIIIYAIIHLFKWFTYISEKCLRKQMLGELPIYTHTTKGILLTWKSLKAKYIYACMYACMYVNEVWLVDDEVAIRWSTYDIIMCIHSKKTTMLMLLPRAFSLYVLLTAYIDVWRAASFNKLITSHCTYI